MNEPTHSEAATTDLPSSKSSRRKRLALRFAVLVAAVSVLGAAYWFTRPPELVWWRSPPIDKTGFHVCVLMPHNWTLDWVSSAEQGLHRNPWDLDLVFVPCDRRPWFLKKLFPRQQENARLTITVLEARDVHTWPEAEAIDIPNLRQASAYTEPAFLIRT